MAGEHGWQGRTDVTPVVLAGGRSRRFGADKLAALLDGVPVLDHLLGALPEPWPVVLVGPARETVRTGVRWVLEDPPGGGPLAGVAAGVAAVATDLVLVLAGDMPRAVGAVPALLAVLDADPSAGAAVAVDDDGHANPLLALYRLDALRAALPDDPAGVPAKRLLALSHTGVRVVGLPGRDVDTPEDLARLRHDV